MKIEVIAMLIVIIVFLFIFMVRSALTLRERQRLRGTIDYRKDNWPQKLNEIERVSYTRMVFQFWKPIRSFYKDFKIR